MTTSTRSGQAASTGSGQAWHRLINEAGEIAWTDTPAAYGVGRDSGWTVTDTTNRPPRDHEDRVGGKWVMDEGKAKVAARRRKLRAMHRDELVDHIVEVVLERLKAAGWMALP